MQTDKLGISDYCAAGQVIVLGTKPNQLLEIGQRFYAQHFAVAWVERSVGNKPVRPQNWERGSGERLDRTICRDVEPGAWRQPAWPGLFVHWPGCVAIPVEQVAVFVSFVHPSRQLAKIDRVVRVWCVCFGGHTDRPAAFTGQRLPAVRPLAILRQHHANHTAIAAWHWGTKYHRLAARQAVQHKVEHLGKSCPFCGGDVRQRQIACVLLANCIHRLQVMQREQHGVIGGIRLRVIKRLMTRSENQ